MNLILIRHSKSLVNPNIPIPTWGLSEEGVILAKKLNGITQIKTLDVIYSSLQPKALETQNQLLLQISLSLLNNSS